MLLQHNILPRIGNASLKTKKPLLTGRRFCAGEETEGRQRKMAERGGFEPPNGKNPLTVFETAAFDRSAISPEFKKM